MKAVVDTFTVLLGAFTVKKIAKVRFPLKYLQFYIVQTTAALASVTAEHLVRASLEQTDDLSIDPPLLSHHIHKPLKVTLRIVRTIYIIPNPISLLLSNEIFHTLYISYLASSHITQSTMHNSGLLVVDVGQFNVTEY